MQKPEIFECKKTKLVQDEIKNDWQVPYSNSNKKTNGAKILSIFYLQVLNAWHLFCFFMFSDSCKNPTVLKREGSFQSPNYPNHYPNWATYCWIIEIPHDLIAQKPFITLEFKNFNVERDSRCNYDKVLVYDGWESSNPLFWLFCGHNTPPPIHATRGKVLVKFISDDVVTATGFNATFEFTSLSGWWLLGFHVLVSYSRNYLA